MNLKLFKLLINKYFIKNIKKFLIFLIKIYKFYLALILLAPIIIPIYLLETDINYNPPIYLLVYGIIFFLGLNLYIYRTGELKEIKENEKLSNKLNINNFSNNFNKNNNLNYLTKKEIKNKKLNIRKILEKNNYIK